MVVTNGATYWGRSVKMASVATVDCQSRYGLQDWATPAWTWLSDAMNATSASRTLTGIASLLDSGNRDVLQDINGGQTGFTIDYSGGTAVGTSYYNISFSPGSTTPVTYVSLPLGLPLTVTSSSVYLPRATLIENYGPTIQFPYSVGTTYSPRAARGIRRWHTDYTTPGPTANVTGNSRCVLSAE